MNRKKREKDKHSLRRTLNNTIFMLRYAFRYVPAYAVGLIILQVLFA